MDGKAGGSKYQEGSLKADGVFAVPLHSRGVFQSQPRSPFLCWPSAVHFETAILYFIVNVLYNALRIVSLIWLAFVLLVNDLPVC